MILTDISQTAMGLRIASVVENFETDADVRYGILSGAFSNAGDLLTRERVDDLLGRRVRLVEFTSSVFHRERVAGVFMWVETRRDILKGNLTRIILPGDEEYDELLHELRADWIANKAIRDAVDALLLSCDRAMYWFNVQMVAGWLMRTFLTVLEQMNIRRGIDPMEAERQCALVDDYAYRTGNGKMYECGRAFASLTESCEGCDRLAELLVLSNEQIARIAPWRMGMIEELTKPARCEDRETEGQQSPLALPLPNGYTLNPNGIAVPRM